MRKRWLLAISFSSSLILGLILGAYLGFHIGAATGLYQPNVAQPYAKRFTEFILPFMPAEMCADNDECGFNEVAERTQISCQPFTQANAKTMVLFAFGQSNSANHGDSLHKTIEGVYNLNPFDGLCYQAQDPLLGATGEKGSVWMPLAEKLIATSTVEQILIVPFGVGGSAIKRWTADGDLVGRIKRSIDALEQQNIKATHIVWHQGETDARNGTTTIEYIKMFGEVISQLSPLGLDVPIYIATATLCGGEASNVDISIAQQKLPAAYPNVFSGANSDTLGNEMRFDNCHFNQQGLAKHADLWFKALTTKE